jgi:signal transduction histidine kinase
VSEKGIAEAHGIEMSLESQPGEGTTVWFGLPEEPAPELALELKENEYVPGRER